MPLSNVPAGGLVAGALLVGLLLAAGAWAAFSATRPLLESEIHPPPGCGPDVSFRVTGGPGAWNYTVLHVRNGPHRVDDLRYAFSNDTTTLQGTLRNASAPGGSGGVAYVDRAAPGDAVSRGDRLVLASETALSLTLYNGSGRNVGGTWACI